MHDVIFLAMPTAEADAFRAGRPDANGQTPERVFSDGSGNPCRHCLRDIPADAPMLVFAYRPFASLHPYAETGPVFLCGDPCRRFAGSDLPPVVAERPYHMLRGYDADGRIVDGSGGIVARDEVAARAVELLDWVQLVSVHVRSAGNGCYQMRIERGAPGVSNQASAPVS